MQTTTDAPTAPGLRADSPLGRLRAARLALTDQAARARVRGDHRPAPRRRLVPPARARHCRPATTPQRLVPLALVAGAALALSPPARAGARAALALVLGVFGIACGIEAAYYTVNGGPSGDDFTGWLSLAAGLLLLGLGVRDALEVAPHRRQPLAPLPETRRCSRSPACSWRPRSCSPS